VTWRRRPIDPSNWVRNKPTGGPWLRPDIMPWPSHMRGDHIDRTPATTLPQGPGYPIVSQQTEGPPSPDAQFKQLADLAERRRTAPRYLPVPNQTTPVVVHQPDPPWLYPSSASDDPRYHFAR
jgi:hypothetical protein